MSTLHTTLDVDGEPRGIEVEYEFIRASRGARSRMVVPLEPDKGQDIRILGYKWDEGGTELTVGQLDRLAEKCLENEAE